MQMRPRDPLIAKTERLRTGLYENEHCSKKNGPLVRAR